MFLAVTSLAVHAWAVSTAPSGQFNATKNVSFNWSLGTLNITSNHTSLVLNVDNLTTNIAPTYFSTADYAVGAYANFTSEVAVRCLGAGGTPGTKFFVKNSTGDFENTTTALNTGQYAVFYLGPHLDCPPGRYYGNLSVKNVTNTSDYVNVTATVHVPVNSLNTLNSAKAAWFKGNLTSGYHSYYLWTNATQNVSSVTINLSGGLDLFLLDSQGNVLNRSASSGSANESIAYVRLPPAVDLWEIKVGNTSSAYYGYLYFSTLSSTANLLGFGVLNPNQTSLLGFNLSNLGSSVVANVTEGAEIYRVQEWKNLNDNRDFQLLVPAFAQKVRVRMEWANETGKNMTDWNLYLRDANQVLVGSSTGNSSSAIGANLTAEEALLYEGSLNTDNDGFWNISVRNATTTGSLCSYNLTVWVWLNSSLWLTTTFNQSSTFNQSGLPNSTYNITANLTAPRRDLLNGSYGGAIRYTNGSGWVYMIPLSFNVTAGTLIVNGNLTNSTYRWDDNTGINRTGSDVLQLNISVNNTGAYPVYFAGNSSAALTHTTYPTRYMNISVGWPASPVAPGTNTSVLVNVTINTTETANTLGTFRGWLFFNTSNATLNSSSCPYETYNLTIDVNLSSSLVVNITDVSPRQILNASAQNNITVTATVKLVNGTIISNTGLMDDNNFTKVVITERNVTTYSNTTTTLARADAAATCAAGACRINATLPANLIGGNYTVALHANYSTGEVNLIGSASFNSVLINETGLYVASVAGSDLGELGETRTMYANFTVTNYGGMAATNTQITFDNGTCPITVTTYDNGCTAIASGTTYTSTIPANGTQCWYRWKITARNVTGTTVCSTISVKATNRKSFLNATSLSLQVNNLETTTTTTGTSGSTCTSNSNCAWNYRCVGGSCTIIECTGTEKHIVDHACVPYADKLEIGEYENLSITLGGAAETMVMVKDTGDRNIRAKLNVTAVEGITYAMTPADCPLTPQGYCYFTVTFSIGNETSLGEHKCYYKAYKSDNAEVNTVQFFYIEILPTEARKTDLAALHEEYAKTFKDYENQLAVLRLAGIPEANLSKMELLMNQTRSDLDGIKAAMEGDDYATAESLLRSVNSTLRRITSLLEEMGAAEIVAGPLGVPMTTWMIVAGAGAAVIVTAVVIYMLLPPKGYYASYKYRTGTGAGNVKEKIKAGFNKGMKKLKREGEGYKYKYRSK
jgi:hypothetical protein